jgi:hypothetical protein
MDIKLLLDKEEDVGKNSACGPTGAISLPTYPLANQCKGDPVPSTNPCSIHQVVTSVKAPFNLDEDAIFLLLLDKLRHSLRSMLRLFLSRSDEDIRRRHDELDSYQCSQACPMCQILRTRLERLRYQYHGACWTTTHRFRNCTLDIMVPLPSHLEVGERTALPLVVRVRGKQINLYGFFSFGMYPASTWLSSEVRIDRDIYWVFPIGQLPKVGTWIFQVWANGGHLTTFIVSCQPRRGQGYI